MDKILIFGHRKPDTDSVCGAISLSYLKNQMGLNTEPRILSEINSETAFALNKFDVQIPKYLNDVKVQLKNVKFKKNYYVNEETSIFDTYNYMTEKGITGIPIVNDAKKFKGYVSLKEIANELIVSSSNTLDTSFTNIANTLNACSVLKYDDEIEGNILSVTIPYRFFIDTFHLDEHSIIIVGDREHIIDYALKSKVKLIIIVNDRKLTDEQKELAKKNKVNIIITPYDSFKTSRIITLSNPIKIIKRNSSAVCFDSIDYLTDFIEISNKLKHTNYPIVNAKSICEGMLRLIDTNELTRKKVILVDHNEPKQSVDGLNEAEILEIVDHHNIGDINTVLPINFRNMAVGSVNTIIYMLYGEYGIKIPKSIAGLMLSGIISDTLLLASPTTTDLDRTAADTLAKIAKVDLRTYGIELLGSGVSIAGLTKEEVIYKDFKNYTVNDYKIGVGQVFTTSFNEYVNDIPEYVDILNSMSKNNDYKVVCLFITDIIDNNSYLLYNDDSAKYLMDAFGFMEIKEGIILRGVVSRKKQMVPVIMESLEKM